MISKSNKSETGSALIFISVILVVAGMLVSGLLSLATTNDLEHEEQLTYEHMDQITHALSVFAQKNSRLPCPAEPDTGVAPEPFGTERGSGANGTNEGSCPNANDLIGIIPFKTLGLPERAVRDGWRNFITYRMADIPDTGKLHDLCRVYTPPGQGGPLDDDWCTPLDTPPQKNKNEPKAYICCGAIESGFDVVDTNDDSVVYAAGEPPPSNGPEYQPIDSCAPSTSIAAGSTIPDKLAMVLISHGQNSHGAFIGDGTQIDAGGVTAEEEENADLDGAFVSLPRNLIDSAYFDDIVMWRTQSHLLSETGSYSINQIDCSVPLP